LLVAQLDRTTAHNPIWKSSLIFILFFVVFVVEQRQPLTISKLNCDLPGDECSHCCTGMSVAATAWPTKDQTREARSSTCTPSKETDLPNVTPFIASAS
jgi:hypothetical protein